jgi:hypothetical protein
MLIRDESQTLAEVAVARLWVVDSAGKSLALQGIDKDFRAFPFHSIEKRIALMSNPLPRTSVPSLAGGDEVLNTR